MHKAERALAWVEWCKENPERRREIRYAWEKRQKDEHTAWWVADQERRRKKDSVRRANFTDAQKAAKRERGRAANLTEAQKAAKCANARRFYHKNHEKQLERGQQRRRREKSIQTVRHNPETVYRTVSKAVNAALPRHMRDDVISSMLLAVLEGKLLLEQVGQRVKDFVRDYNREYDTFQTLSLDELIPGTNTSRLDMLAAE